MPTAISGHSSSMISIGARLVSEIVRLFAGVGAGAGTPPSSGLASMMVLLWCHLGPVAGELILLVAARRVKLRRVKQLLERVVHHPLARLLERHLVSRNRVVPGRVSPAHLVVAAVADEHHGLEHDRRPLAHEVVIEPEEYRTHEQRADPVLLHDHVLALLDPLRPGEEIDLFEMMLLVQYPMLGTVLVHRAPA